MGRALGEQADRLQALEDVIAVITGFEDAPSPLFGTTLAGKPVVVRDSAFLAASRRAAASVANDHDASIRSWEGQYAAVERELQQLLREEGLDLTDATADARNVGGIGSAGDDEESDRELREQRLREETEREFEAFKAEEAL